MSYNYKGLFMAKYGSKEHLDKILRPDIPHWKDLADHEVPGMTAVIGDAVNNPAMTHEHVDKILKFPFRGNFSTTTVFHKLIAAHSDLESRHINHISEYAGADSIMARDLLLHPSLTSKAVENMIASKKAYGDNVTHLEWKANKLRQQGK